MFYNGFSNIRQSPELEKLNWLKKKNKKKLVEKLNR